MMAPAVRAALLLLSLFLLPGVFAVGFGNLPSEREITYRSGEEIRIPVYVINGEHIRATISTPAVMDPATKGTPLDDNIIDYVTLEDEAPGTGQRQIAVVFRFPEHQMKPGTYYVELFATDYPTEQVTATITAIATVKLRLTVWVLSPEPFLEVTGVGAQSVAEGLDVNVSVAYVSRTEQHLSPVVTVVTVEREGEVLATGRAPPRSLASGARDVVVVPVPTAALPGGDYDVRARVEYADKAAEGGMLLKIGTLHVGITAHTPELAYNATNRFRLNVSNQWNRELRDVFATVRIGTQEKKTASLNIPPFGQTEYEVYFDRDESLAPGPTIAEATVEFRDFDAVRGEYVGKRETFPLPVVVLPPPIVESPIAMRDALTWGLGIALICLVIFLLVTRRREPPAASPVQPPVAPPGN